MANQTSVTGTKNVWPYYAKGNLPPSKSSGGNELGKDQFLHILITQLRHQDPMQPMQDREFIAQMAQFSTVEQIMNMGNELTMLRQSFGFSSGLIGKTVTWNVYDASGKISGTKTGIVDAIVMKDGKQYLKSGTNEVLLESIVKIEQGEVAAE
ncbi:flagellar hook capping FlgD N-terminal domain-containing protein [Paenibacillus alkalitolerans]|uniref:flagellar hook capping FlgD N-terminal domain-containing protein n=1 Tax=Paenibacillus alkalitolerans TaxID=2799335 RepID=UPI0018F2C982|nr:flagellar hook capping FlgD N-terminal domain-containing protein [Paenibacillus alkalitolerans]